MPTTLVADQFGYTGYNVCFVVPDPIAQEVLDIRRSLGVNLTMPPHVTLKGNFIEPHSIDDVRSILETAAAGIPRLSLDLTHTEAWGQRDARLLVISVAASQSLLDLHIRLFLAIEPISTNIYGGTGLEPLEEFLFHATIYQGFSDKRHKEGLEISRRLPLPAAFRADAVHLMGRDPESGWRSIEQFPLRTHADRSSARRARSPHSQSRDQRR